MKYLILTITAMLSVSLNSFAHDAHEHSEVTTPATEEGSSPKMEKVRLDPKADMAMIKNEAKRVKEAPVYPAFIRQFKECAKDELKSCEPLQMFSFFRPPSESCSGTGRNLNWKSIECEVSGKKKVFLAESKEFSTIALCMKNHNSKAPFGGETHTLYREPKEGILGFREMAFFSIGCFLPGGRRSW